MESALLDTIWEKIAAGFIAAADGFDALLMTFDFLGPAIMVFLLAVLTVLITKSLNRIIVTKRYVKLEKEYKHWYNLRQTALTFADREKGKALAKNIDQAELNRAYYDYFFEGLLNSLVTKYLPILFLLAYVNETYRPSNLIELFGRDYVFKYGGAGESPILVGSIFWFVVSILLIYLAFFIFKKIFRKARHRQPGLVKILSVT